MKISIFFAGSFASAASINDANTGARQAIDEIAAGTRSDGNALLISQMLEFYLTTIHGVSANKVEQMLSYGCYCQLLTTRRIGLGEPVDEFDAICARYQQCTRCVQTDEAGQLVDIGGIEDVECNWENGRYEISFQAGSDRVFCDLNKNDCGVNLCKCDEQLAFEMAENRDLFQTKHSSQKGFEFADECLATPPNPGQVGERGELQCCGKYPERVPYHDKNGGRQCCVDKVYSTDDKQCCSNGNVVGLDGSC